MKKMYFFAVLLVAGISNAQVITFADPEFKAKLVQANATDETHMNAYTGCCGTYQPIKVDLNNNGEIEVSEALMVNGITIFNSQDISDLGGIEYFTNLNYLNCSYNPIPSIDFTGISGLTQLSCSSTLLTALDLSGIPGLQQLDCSSNSLTSLDLSVVPGLKYLDCYYNDLSVLDLSPVPGLQSVNCSGNNLASLDVSGNPSLAYIYANMNQISTLDVSGHAALSGLQCTNNGMTGLNISGTTLFELFCQDNLLTQLDLSGQNEIYNLYCNGNLLTELDAMDLTNANTISCSNNPNLTTLLVKNGGTENLEMSALPNLHYICADNVDLPTIQNIVNQFGYNCQINSYCSFVPGGDFYTIQGNTRFDANANGCDASDVNYPLMKFTITDGTVNGSIVSDNSGAYSIPVQAGTHTVTPILENPEYFSISPASATVTFPTSASPFVQNFCVTANSVYHDLEVVIIPTLPARPGFDANYKIVYKNKGTQAESGSLVFSFENSKTDFVSAIPNSTSQAGNTITWDFTALQPFEIREINVVLNVNSPMETPAVNIGDKLNFGATVNPVAGDQTPLDNVFGFKQTVVGSLDPNDKTCLEGNIVGPEMIDEYVHYIIRFENTGTANAENIVVKDMIDTAKFDISTLIPLDASHPFTTRIIEASKVEFIFENIHLPFDDANNDGYVAFKIKTKPSLVVGNTFSNTASIYFDYNFPIVTNTATTTIQLLGIPDFEFSDVFTLYPNPAQNTLNIQPKNGVEIKSISIYNLLGQLVQVETGVISAIDISKLQTGQYFLKVHSGKGNAVTKFIKF